MTPHRQSESGASSETRHRPAPYKVDLRNAGSCCPTKKTESPFHRASSPAHPPPQDERSAAAGTHSRSPPPPYTSRFPSYSPVKAIMVPSGEKTRQRLNPHAGSEPAGVAALAAYDPEIISVVEDDLRFANRRKAQQERWDHSARRHWIEAMRLENADNKTKANIPGRDSAHAELLKMACRTTANLSVLGMRRSTGVRE